MKKKQNVRLKQGEFIDKNGEIKKRITLAPLTKEWKPTTTEFVPGYHITEIPKGKLGEISKILEESYELSDAEFQGSKIMQLVECADIYGALEAYVTKLGHTMEDLKTFSNITKRAFQNGKRK